LRVRASYGTSAAPPNQYFAYAAGYGATRYDGQPAIAPVAIGNPDYEWEKTHMTNLGLDLAFFDHRLRLVADWYNRETKGFFLNEQLSMTSGFDSRNINAGNVRNRGVELDLNGDIIRKKDLTWSAGVNFTYNRNLVTSLGNANQYQVSTFLIKEGLPVNSHYIVKYAGVDPQTGEALYYDRNGNINSNYSFNASVAEFGANDPTIYGGFNTSVRWKNWSADVLFSYVTDISRYNAMDWYTLNNNSNVYSNQSRRWLDRWRKAGEAAEEASFGSPRTFSSRHIQDASFLRLRTAQISYNLPESLLARTQVIKGVTVYLQGQNLLTFTKWNGFDPEDYNANAFFEYPAPRTMVAGVRVQF
jgi:outer membrane receptor protein involved in Fe transport